MITVYGIKNCDTIKKTRNWFDKHDIDYKFHDIRHDGIGAETIASWIDRVGWENVLNKRSTSWRNLDNDVQQSVSADNIITLLKQNPTLIKRPVVDADGIITIGFNADTYKGIFN